MSICFSFLRTSNLLIGSLPKVDQKPNIPERFHSLFSLEIKSSHVHDYERISNDWTHLLNAGT